MNRQEIIQLLDLLTELYPTFKFAEGESQAKVNQVFAKKLAMWEQLLRGVPYLEFQTMLVTKLKSGELESNFAPTLAKLFAMYGDFKRDLLGETKYDAETEFGKACWEQMLRTHPKFDDKLTFNSPEEHQHAVRLHNLSQRKEFRRVWDEKSPQRNSQLALGRPESELLLELFPHRSQNRAAITLNNVRKAVSERKTKRTASKLYPDVKLALEELVELLRGWLDLGISHHVVLQRMQTHVESFPGLVGSDHFEVLKSDRFMSDIIAKWGDSCTDEQRLEMVKLIEKLEGRNEQSHEFTK